MKRQFLAMAALGAAMLGANLPITTAPATVASSKTAQVTVPASQAPKSDSTQVPMEARQVDALPQIAYGDSARYIRKEGLRRVKYGKSRWIMLS